MVVAFASTICCCGRKTAQPRARLPGRVSRVSGKVVMALIAYGCDEEANAGLLILITVV